MIIRGIILKLTVTTRLYRRTLKINKTTNKQITVTVSSPSLPKRRKNICNVRESNPGLPRGRREFYHWTNVARNQGLFLSIILLSKKSHIVQVLNKHKSKSVFKWIKMNQGLFCVNIMRKNKCGSWTTNPNGRFYIKNKNSKNF